MAAADHNPVDQKPALLVKPIEEMDFFSRKFEILRSNATRSMDMETTNDDDEDIGPTMVEHSLDTGLHLSTFDSAKLSGGSTADDEIKHNNQVSTLRLKLDCLNEENKKLKSMLDHISKNYRALQAQIILAMQQQVRNNGQEQGKDQRTASRPSSTTLCARQFMDPSPSSTALVINEPSNSEDEIQQAPASSTPITTSNTIKVMPKAYDDQDDENQIARTLSSLQSAPDEQSCQRWGANKSSKLTQPKTTEQAPDDIVPCRKARVSIRARSEAPLMSDGCQWRKYGQKMAKGNPCPRAYYRCTMAVGCPVRKQVQRCAEDKTILITTYEGNHNHPLPPAATVMANTTSAAASMLLSGSTMSNKENPTHNTTSTLFPPWTYTSSLATLSASAPFPTITLDLTHPLNTLQFQPSGPPPSTLFPLSFHSTLPFQLTHTMQMHSSTTTTSKLPLISAALQQLAGQRHYSSMVETITSALATDPNLATSLASAVSSILGTASQNNKEANSNSKGLGVDPTVAPPALSQPPPSLQPTRSTMPAP